MKTVRRLDGWTARTLVGAAVLLAVYPSSRLTAQDSQFGIRGLGTPGRFETVRARSTAGAFAPFDGMSTLMEAQLADVTRLTATAMGGTSYRNTDLSGTKTSLRTTRFPMLAFAEPVLGRLRIAGSYGTYLDRSWSVSLRDSVLIRGVMQPYTDQVTSDGAVADVRFAGAARLSGHFALGAGLHLLSGSTKVSARRVFDPVNGDSVYQPIMQRDEVRYTGIGFSASGLVDFGPTLRIAAFARSDGRLRAWLSDVLVSQADLPRAAGGGVRWAPTPSVRFAASVVWRSWSDAATAGGGGGGVGSFDTFNWSAGAEVGGGYSPLRFGVRGGRLPFGPGATAPTEIGLAAGTGRAFSEGRALLDVGFEHLRRKGGGLDERVWTFLLGLTIRP